VRETIVYLSEHLELEPWGSTEPIALLTGPGARRACPECDAPAAPGDEFCRRCGAALARAGLASGR
jgi:predicted amidophosphoribosyltransferase